MATGGVLNITFVGRFRTQAASSRGPEFLRLANALSMLYFANSEERRLLDAMLLAAQR